MKKALIITYYWPPSGGSGVQRWLKFVKYFRDFGIEPVVFTAENPNYPLIDKSLKNDIPENIEIIKQPIWEPNRILGRKKSENAGFINSKPSFFGKIIHYIRANYFIPDARKFWIKPSVKKLSKFIKNNKIGVIITTGPPQSVHLIGMNLQRNFGLKWIADFRDPWTNIEYFQDLPLTKRTKRIHEKLEKEVVSRADEVVVVSKTMKKDYDKYSNNITVITNGFDEENFTNKVDIDKKFTLTHIGLMFAKSSSQMFWETIAELTNEIDDFAKDFKLKLVGAIDNSIKEQITKYNLHSNVDIIGYIPHNKVAEMQRKSQVLLLLISDVPRANGIITGKIFEYLTANRPILAIAPKNGDLAEIINLCDVGCVVDFYDKKALKKTLLDLYNKYKTNKLTVKPKNTEQFHRRNLTEKMANLIEKTLLKK